MGRILNWLEKLGKEYRERVREVYKELSGEELDEFLGSDNDD